MHPTHAFTPETRPTAPSRPRAEHEPHREQGSFLLDMMLGIAIFALVATSATTLVGQNRLRVQANAAKSDAQSLAVALEARVTDGSDLPTTLTTAEVRSHGVFLSSGNRIGDYRLQDGALRYCIEHADGPTGGAYAVYAADLGGVVEHGREGGCDGALDSLDEPETEDPGPSTPPVGTPTPTPTEEPTPSPLYIADDFTGSGPLGTTQHGGATWTYRNATSADFARSSGGLVVTANPSAHPIAAVDAEESDVALVVLNPTADTAAYLRIRDGQNYFRIALQRTEKTGVAEPTITWRCTQQRRGYPTHTVTVTRDSTMTEAAVEQEMRTQVNSQVTVNCTADSPVTPKPMYAWTVHLHRVAGGTPTAIGHRVLSDTEVDVTSPIQQFGVVAKDDSLNVLIDGAPWQTFTSASFADATVHGIGAAALSSTTNPHPSATGIQISDAS